MSYFVNKTEIASSFTEYRYEKSIQKKIDTYNLIIVNVQILSRAYGVT